MKNRAACFLLFVFILNFSLASSPPEPPERDDFVVPASAMEVIPEWQARVELARVLSYAQRYDESIHEYQLALKVRPDQPDLRMEYGQVLGWAGHTDAAIKELGGVPPSSLTPAAAILLADLLLGQKAFDRAAALYEQALKQQPDDQGTRFKLARVLSWEKRYDESLAQYRLLLAARPHDVQLQRHYAQTLSWAGQLDEAIKAWRQTLPADPAS